jgi:hypothetical protein
MKILAFQVWKSLGLEDIKMTTKCFKIFHFKTKDDVYSVLENGHGCLEGR